MLTTCPFIEWRKGEVGVILPMSIKTNHKNQYCESFFHKIKDSVLGTLSAFDDITTLVKIFNYL
jgi:hypothetical protein